MINLNIPNHGLGKILYAEIIISGEVLYNHYLAELNTMKLPHKVYNKAVMALRDYYMEEDHNKFTTMIYSLPRNWVETQYKAFKEVFDEEYPIEAIQIKSMVYERGYVVVDKEEKELSIVFMPEPPLSRTYIVQTMWVEAKTNKPSFIKMSYPRKFGETPRLSGGEFWQGKGPNGEDFNIDGELCEIPF